MAARDLILDPAEIDFDHVIAGIEEIRRFNPQRFEMEQLTAIVHFDSERMICVGYKDISDEEFWIRGHMPGAPLMPGVLMCEAAAQLAGFFVARADLMKGRLLGFGGLDEVRFRDTVSPGDRLVVVAQQLKVRPGTMLICRFQAFVRESLVCEGQLRGIALPEELLAKPPSDPA